MKGSVNFEIKGDIALLSVKNPPVNTLSSGVRQGLYDAINKAIADDSVKAIVITGNARAFMAGVDIQEIGEDCEKAVSLRKVFDTLERCDKPLIAAINGLAFGAGLELALCCDYRIASPLVPLAMPQVKLGICPGYGGTQRLPRLVGVKEAIKILINGAPILASKAFKIGILDEVIRGNVVQSGITFAEKIIANGSTKRRVSAIDNLLKMDKNSSSVFDNAREQASRIRRNQFAPQQTIACIEAAVNANSFKEGLEIEQKLHQECLDGPQRKAMIHLYFAERESSKIPDIPRDTQTSEIKQVSIVGAGVMGSGIAKVFANNGIPVLLHDKSSEDLMHGFNLIKQGYSMKVNRGKITQKRMDENIDRIKPIISFEKLGSSDMVIEAVNEDLALKQEVFMALDKVMKPGAILASNTSALDIDAIASVTKRPEHVIGTHFFSPPLIIKLLEVVRGKSTSKEVVATIMKLGRKLKKTVIIAGNCPGFIGNRMSYGYIEQASRLVLEGASPARIDKVLYDFGFTHGPFVFNDIAGLDFGTNARKMYGSDDIDTTRIPNELCELGRFGYRSGKGYYNYKGGNRNPIPDPEVDELIDRVRKEVGYVQRELTDDEILKRCLFALINIGADILDEGIVLRSSDIDLAYTYAFWFPAYRGGPMFYADSVGLENILADSEYFYNERSEFWKPAELIKRLVAENKNFSSYVRRP